MRTETYTLPAHWASYLINGDASSFSLYGEEGEKEVEAIDDWVKDTGDLGFCLGCSDEPEFSRNHDATGVLACDCLEFTFEVLP